MNARNRERLARFLDSPHSSTVEVTGHVLEADVRQLRFQLWFADSTAHQPMSEARPITAPFSPDQEQLVTSALKDHRSLRVRVRGVAIMSPQGELLRFTSVDELQLLPDEPQQLDPAIPPIESVLTDLASRVAGEDWARLPSDLTDNLDHYLYGTPKR